MPASFDLNADSEELWVPAAFTSERKATHDEHYLAVYGRLKRGITQQQAHADLTRIAQQLRVQFPKDDQELAFRIVPLMQDFVGDYSTRLYILFGAVVVVLLIACTNVANLLLARGAARAGEIAVRSALGASRGRLFRQLLAESLVIAGVAAGAGLAVASWGIHALVSLSPPGIPRLEQTRLNGPVLLFALGAAILSAVVSGAAPALRAVRGDLQAVLKDSEGSGFASGSFLADGRIVTGTMRGAGQLWTASGESLGVFKPTASLDLFILAVHPDGLHFAATVNNSSVIEVWNASGELVSTLRGHKKHAWSASFSADGHTLASGSADRTARVWDWRAQRQILELHGNNATVHKVDFDSSGGALLGACHDGSAPLDARCAAASGAAGPPKRSQ
jgi:hypothetical protein